MHILVTNDDGITAPGLLCLAEAMQQFEKVSVLAPDHDWSGGGHVKTLNRPLRVRRVKLGNGASAFTSDGAPSDCVAFFNVNVPTMPLSELKGIQLTRQGLRVYRDRLDKRQDPRGNDYYWIGGDRPTGVPKEGTDVGALAQGYASVTPLQLDLTAYHALRSMADWEWEMPASIEVTAPSKGQVSAAVAA